MAEWRSARCAPCRRTTWPPSPDCPAARGRWWWHCNSPGWGGRGRERIGSDRNILTSRTEGGSTGRFRRSFGWNWVISESKLSESARWPGWDPVVLKQFDGLPTKFNTTSMAHPNSVAQLSEGWEAVIWVWEYQLHWMILALDVNKLFEGIDIDMVSPDTGQLLIRTARTCELKDQMAHVIFT